MQEMETIDLPDYGINTAAAYGPRIRGYTAAQMRAYGKACAKAERDALAQLMERQHEWITNVAAANLIRAAPDRFDR